jgi:guanosine-3',5'-bis(diphosphate) 3'-pyrophosphohydrolase
MLDAAILFAAEAHRGQTRKYNPSLPYIVHPIEVMSIVATVPHSPEMLAAAVLHDVVEDTDVGISDIFKTFGQVTHDLVWAMTDQNSQGNRATRKAAECERWSRQLPSAQTIKIADLISNTSSIVEHDPKFAETYLAEKRQLLNSLTLGSPTLWSRAYQQLERHELPLHS